MSEEKKQTNEKKGDERKKRNWKLLLIPGFIVLLIGIYFASISVFQNWNNVEYKGLEFSYQDFDGLKLYYYSYLFEDRGSIFKYNLYLHKNPAKNDVPVVGQGSIDLDTGRAVYVTTNSTGLGQCSEAALATAKLTGFFLDNKMDIRVGSVDRQEAKEKDIHHATCEIRPYKYNPVIVLQEGKETVIELNKTNRCYVINVADCEAIAAVEKFIVESIVDSRNPSYNSTNILNLSSSSLLSSVP